MENYQILHGDALTMLRTLPTGSVHCVVTSPPYYGLRDYGQDGQIGLEATPAEYVARLVEVFEEVRRVLRDDGVMFLNLGDSYASGKGTCHNPGGGSKSYIQEKQRFPLDRGNVTALKNSGLKPKDLMMIPARVAIALQEAGWWLRADIIWAKRAPMPESVTDRPTRSHEHIFLLTKKPRYFYDAEAVKEAGTMHPTDWNIDGTPKRESKRRGDFGGKGDQAAPGREPFRAIAPTRNQRDVWHLSPEPFSDRGETVRRVPVARDGIDGDTKRTTSPDCPVHGDRPDQVATVAYDGRVTNPLIRNERNGSRPAQAQQGEIFPVGKLPGENSLEQNSDSLRPGYAHVAIDHSSETHRTAPAPLTNRPYTLSAETTARTERSATLPDSVDLDDHTSENSNEPGDSGDHPSVEIHSRNVRKSSWFVPPECTCSFYHEITETTSHFATFPTGIPRRAILAGTSEYGCCPACGAPYKRVVEHTKQPDTSAKGSRFDVGKTGTNGNGRTQPGERYTKQTTGWQPTCTCGAPDDLQAGDLEAIATPTGERMGDDPTMTTGRNGYNRPRGDNEGQRPITRYEQRHYAAQLRTSPKRAAMEHEAGSAFAHYLRTDRSGARPIPDDLLNAWIARGWLKRVAVPQWEPLPPVPCTVLDPFGGSGTTAAVAVSLGRKAILIELNADYIELAHTRVGQAQQPLLQLLLPPDLPPNRAPELAGLWDSVEPEPNATSLPAAEYHR